MVNKTPKQRPLIEEINEEEITNPHLVPLIEQINEGEITNPHLRELVSNLKGLRPGMPSACAVGYNDGGHSDYCPHRDHTDYSDRFPSF